MADSGVDETYRRPLGRSGLMVSELREKLAEQGYGEDELNAMTAPDMEFALFQGSERVSEEDQQGDVLGVTGPTFPTSDEEKQKKEEAADLREQADELDPPVETHPQGDSSFTTDPEKLAALNEVIEEKLDSSGNGEVKEEAKPAAKTATASKSTASK